MSDLTVRGIKIENLEKQVAELEAERVVLNDLLDREIGWREKAEAVASSSDTLLGEATRWAKDARERADKAEAGQVRFSAILDRGLTTMNDKQDIVGTLALRDAAIAYDEDLRARAEEGNTQGHACPGCGQRLLYGTGHINCPARAEEGSET